MRPRVYEFHCPNCGTYAVERDRLMEFIPETVLPRFLAKEMDQTVTGFRAKFEEMCPRCATRGGSTMDLVVLRKPRLD